VALACQGCSPGVLAGGARGVWRPLGRKQPGERQRISAGRDGQSGDSLFLSGQLLGKICRAHYGSPRRVAPGCGSWAKARAMWPHPCGVIEEALPRAPHKVLRRSVEGTHRMVAGPMTSRRELASAPGSGWQQELVPGDCACPFASDWRSDFASDLPSDRERNCACADSTSVSRGRSKPGRRSPRSLRSLVTASKRAPLVNIFRRHVVRCRYSKSRELAGRAFSSVFLMFRREIQYGDRRAPNGEDRRSGRRSMRRAQSAFTNVLAVNWTRPYHATSMILSRVAKRPASAGVSRTCRRERRRRTRVRQTA